MLLDLITIQAQVQRNKLLYNHENFDQRTAVYVGGPATGKIWLEQLIA